jgi:hypothetical protein
MARVGVQMGTELMAFVNACPSSAKASKLGVRTGSSMKPIACRRN